MISKSTCRGYTATKCIMMKLIQVAISECWSTADGSWSVYAHHVIITSPDIEAWGGVMWKTYCSFGCGCVGLLVEN
jgi:hypothetical protein